MKKTPTELRTEIVETRERLDEAEGTITVVTDLRHELQGSVEAQRRSAPRVADGEELRAAYERFVDPGDLGEDVDQARKNPDGDPDRVVDDLMGEQFEYLRGNYVKGKSGRTDPFGAFRSTHKGSGPAASFVDDLESYVTARTYAPGHRQGMRKEFRTAATAKLATAERLLDFLDLVVEAARNYRDSLRDRLNTTREGGNVSKGLVQQFLDAVDAGGVPGSDPATFLDSNPVALLPVRVETRFVDGSTTTLHEDVTEPELRIRVFPDDVHVDSHERELTDEEQRMGENFWAKLWVVAHPDPVAAMDGSGQGRRLSTRHVPDRRLVEHVSAAVDPREFDSKAKLYRQVKARAWRQLVERFGQQRAAWVVHRLKPEAGAAELLAGWDVEFPNTGSNSLRGGVDPGSDEWGDWNRKTPADGPLSDDPGGRTETPPWKRNDAVPDLSFPAVQNRPDTWTRQPRARLLPDRWVVYGWAGGIGGSGPDVVEEGKAIREPLGLGPDPQAGDDHQAPDTSSATAPAPGGMDWTVDFQKAVEAGMAMRVTKSDLGGIDPTGVTFDRLVVVGVKATMSAEQSTTGLRALFEAHHYTDGLEFLDPGTRTNNTEKDAEYGDTDDPEASLPVECSEPLAEFGGDARPEFPHWAPTDGDVLARTLGIADPTAEPHDHVFAHVENADALNGVAQWHANAALWEGTFGNYFRNVLSSNRWTADGDMWVDIGRRNPSPGGYGASPTNPKEGRRHLGSTLVWEDELRRHFVKYVRPQGPLPSLRVGRQPYGILPVTDAGKVSFSTGVGKKSLPGVTGLLERLRDDVRGATDDLVHLSDGAMDQAGTRELIRDVLQRTANGSAYETRVMAKYSGRKASATVEPDDGKGTSKSNSGPGGPNFSRVAGPAWKSANWNSEDWRRKLGLALQSTGLVGTGRYDPKLDPRLAWFRPTDESGAGPVDRNAGDLVGRTPGRFLELLSGTGSKNDGVGFATLQELGWDPEFDDLEIHQKKVESVDEDLLPTNPGSYDDAELLMHLLTEADGTQWHDLMNHPDKGVEWSGTDQKPGDLDHLANKWHRHYRKYGDPGTLHTLFRQSMRFSLLQAYVGGALRRGLEEKALPGTDRSTAKSVPFPEPGSFNSVPSVWDSLTKSRGGTSLVEEVERGTSRVEDVRTSMRFLSSVPPSRHRRLLPATLALATHRVDAWETSLSWRRLVDHREGQTELLPGDELTKFSEYDRFDDDSSVPLKDKDLYRSLRADTGVAADATGRDYPVANTYVGGYAVVENLRADAGGGTDPARERTEFTQAPSPQHATTAALLRGAHKHLGEDDLAVDFSAGRVRAAESVLEGIRRGQQLGALLGYRFERTVKEETDGSDVHHLEDYREAFPSKAGELEHGGGTKTKGETADAAMDVTDGYRLYRAWVDAGSPGQFFSKFGVGDTQTYRAAIGEVVDTVEAVRDVLLAEDLHQIGKGNFQRAGSSLDGLAEGEGVPDRDVLRTPSDGVDVSHRLLTLFGDPAERPDDATYGVLGTGDLAEVDPVATRTATTVGAGGTPGSNLGGGQTGGNRGGGRTGPTGDPGPADEVLSAVRSLPADRGADPPESPAHPRGVAAGHLDRWVGEFLPDLSSVGYRAEFQWTDEREFATGTFSTPTETGTVTVDDVGFRPDAVVLVASTAVEDPSATETGTGAVGWMHGVAARAHSSGRLKEGFEESATCVATTPGGRTVEANADRAVSLVDVADDGTTRRTVGTVARSTGDGFEVEFPTAELDAPVAVEYLAVRTGVAGSVEVGQFRTPKSAGTHTESLSLEDADHAMLAVGAPGAPGFSHGHAVADGTGISEWALGATTRPGADGRVAARVDGSIHLPYPDGTATGASVTGLGGDLSVTFGAPPNGSFRDDGAVCTYLAFETPEEVPTPSVGLLSEGHNSTGFEPGALSLVALPGLSRSDLPSKGGTPTGGTSARASGSVGFSHGFALGGTSQRSLTHAVGPGGPSHAATGTPSAPVGLVNRDGDDRVVCRVTGTTDRGFEAAFTEGSAGDAVVGYVAWPRSPGELAHTEPTAGTVDELHLSPVDLLFHGRRDAEADRSQLERRVVYELFRTRGKRNLTYPVPDDAAVELTFTEAPPDAAVTVAELLEVLRSLRELVADGRPVDADDLVHGAESRGPGYTDPRNDDSPERTTVGDLGSRALSVTGALRDVRTTVDERVAALSAQNGDSLGASATTLREATERVDAAVPLGSIATATAALDDDGIDDALNDPSLANLGTHLPGSRTVRAGDVDDVGDLLLWELETLSLFLPAGPTDHEAADAPTTVRALTAQTITGTADAAGSVDVYVWSRSPRWEFSTVRTDVGTDPDGGFEVSLDLDGAVPGVSLGVVAVDRGPPSGSGIVDLGTTPVGTLDAADRVGTVGSMNATDTEATAFMDARGVYDGDRLVGRQVVVSDPGATHRLEDGGVVVEVGGDRRRVPTEFPVGEVRSRRVGDARELVVVRDGYEPPPGGLRSVDSLRDPGLQGPSAEVLERAAEHMDTVDSAALVQGGRDAVDGDVAYSTTARVLAPSAPLTVVVDPDATGSAGTATIEGDAGTASRVTVTATRADGTAIDSATLDADGRGRFSARLDFSGVDPRTAFEVEATDGSKTVYRREGCTVSPDDRRSPREVLERLPVLPRVLYLDRELPAVDPSRAGSPGEELADAIDGVDWNRVHAELSAAESLSAELDADPDADDPVLTERLLNRIRVLVDPDDIFADAVESLSLKTTVSDLYDVVDPVADLGVTDLFSAQGSPRSELGVLRGGGDVPAVGAALAHAVENPADLSGDDRAVDREFAPGFARRLRDEGGLGDSQAAALAGYLGQLAEYPPWFPAYLDGAVAKPHLFLRDLSRLLYDPSTFVADVDHDRFSAQLGAFVSAMGSLSRLEEVLDPTPTEPVGPLPGQGSASELSSVGIQVDADAVDALDDAVTVDATGGSFEVVVENYSGSDSTLAMTVSGGATGALSVPGGGVVTVGADEVRSVELAASVPSTERTGRLTVRDADTGAEAAVAVTVPAPPNVPGVTPGGRQLPSGPGGRSPVGELRPLLDWFQSNVLGEFASPGPLPSGSTARSSFAGRYDEDAREANGAAGELRSSVRTAVEAGPFDDALREAMAEPLRRELLRASYCGVYGATPRSAVGGEPGEIADLLAQARAVRDRIDDRLQEVGSALAGVDADSPTGETVDALVDAVETPLDDGFVVLPPFVSHNPGELTATFGADLVPDDEPLAPESLVGRMAEFRDRPALFREAYSYGEVMSGDRLLSLSVGQLPHRPDDRWIGLSDPDPGRQSLVVQFEGEARKHVGSGLLAGLFVDDWSETVPSDTRTTGVAVNYDAPDATAPNSILLAVPHSDKRSFSWETTALRDRVTEAVELSRVRMLDLEDLQDEFGELLPAVWLPDGPAPKPPAPSVDLSALDADAWETFDRFRVGDLDSSVVGEFLADPGGSLDSMGGDLP